MWVSAILLGLISSLHCIGMCGPIAMMLPVSRNPGKKTLQLLTYHFGRILAYATIGLIFGTLGRGFHLAGWQQYLSIFAGVGMLLVAFVPERQLARYNFSKPLYRLLSKIKSALGQRLRNPSFTSLLTIGLLNGFLPCAMVYAALFGALASDSIVASVGFMTLYGIGTIPLMTTVVYLQQWLTHPLRQRIQKVIPYALACLGILFVLRGLGLDIDHVSPSALQLFVQTTPNCK
ncbi:sulfite exporter TauE/SafE family protein [Flavobacterium caeni]|uniref:Urease accessory protein UreH-like transmembrane domain-containing protein n=1 Tax=Flavobacterium caeni TaxID=490189 RepID=A0A1G5CYA4_9FLAO|nr:sulfite exporter TauE/SafE family protein [Flavobacterium caeni]SCY07404.1 hypothetical protein SAMN02927903_00681 [Flavobacterium caeni]